MFTGIFCIFIGVCLAGYLYHRYTTKTVDFVQTAADVVNAEINRVKVYANGSSQVSNSSTVPVANTTPTANT